MAWNEKSLSKHNLTERFSAPHRRAAKVHFARKRSIDAPSTKDAVDRGHAQCKHTPQHATDLLNFDDTLLGKLLTMVLHKRRASEWQRGHTPCAVTIRGSSRPVKGHTNATKRNCSKRALRSNHNPVTAKNIRFRSGWRSSLDYAPVPVWTPSRAMYAWHLVQKAQGVSVSDILKSGRHWIRQYTNNVISGYTAGENRLVNFLKKLKKKPSAKIHRTPHRNMCVLHKMKNHVEKKGGIFHKKKRPQHWRSVLDNVINREDSKTQRCRIRILLQFTVCKANLCALSVFRAALHRGAKGVASLKCFTTRTQRQQLLYLSQWHFELHRLALFARQGLLNASGEQAPLSSWSSQGGRHGASHWQRGTGWPLGWPLWTEKRVSHDNYVITLVNIQLLLVFVSTVTLTV